MQSPCLTPGWNAAITAALMAILPGCVTKQAPEQKPTLEQELRSAGGFEWMLQDPESRRAQILITEIVKDPNGRTQLRSHGYRVDAEYFYPASAIKLCAAVAALQLIETLEHTHGLADLAKAPLRIEPLFPGDRAQTIDDPKPPQVPLTVGREIRKLCLVSDNPAFNRLFDLVGHAEMNQSMHALGLNSVVINHRLSESRKIPNPQAAAGVSFHPPGRPPILIAPRTSDLKFANSKPGLLVGSSYLQGDGKVDRPMDFTRRNGISLVDLQGLLIKVVRPEAPSPGPRLRLKPNHRALLVNAMKQLPRESEDPIYPAGDFPDEFVKFLLPGVRMASPSTEPGSRIEIIGKIGRAYGFTVENSYVENPATGKAVVVTAVLYTNSDGILNDDRYEYATEADPFFKRLGEWVTRRFLMD